MSYEWGVAVHESAKGEVALEHLPHAIKTVTFPATGLINDTTKALNWRDFATVFNCNHAVVLVVLPATSSVLGDSVPSHTNWLYAAPHRVKGIDHLPQSNGAADHWGAHIAAIRSHGGILFLPHGGKWDIVNPDTNDAHYLVLDGRNPAFVEWVTKCFRVAHALHPHTVDVEVPAFNGTGGSIVTLAKGGRWRTFLRFQNVGPDPENTAADPATDPPVRIWTTTAPTAGRGIVLYPRDVFEIRSHEIQIAQEWQATAVGGLTYVSVSGWV